VVVVSWPTASLDPVRRLRVLAHALPSVAFVERHIDAPYERLWSFITDFEHSVPSFDFSVRSVRVREDPNGLRLVATSPLGLRTLFDVDVTDGFCWMASPTYVVGMAATPDGDGTHYAHLEGVPKRGLRLARPLFRLMVASDVRAIARLVSRSS
jgi:hypothetical protein